MKNITTSLLLFSSLDHEKNQTQSRKLERDEKHNIYTLENGVENVPRYFQESRGGTTSFVENSFYSLFLSLSLSRWAVSLFEKLARLPVEVEFASEFRYRSPILRKDDDIVIAISQSGETADTLEAVRFHFRATFNSKRKE